MNDLLSDFSTSNEQMLKLVISIIVILFIVSILRSVFRFVMPVVIIGLVMVVFLGFTPSEVINKGKQFASDGTHFFLENIFPFIDSNEGKENDRSEILPESKSSIEENGKKFFGHDEKNNNPEIVDEQENNANVNMF
jgi:hypothetical protein